MEEKILELLRKNNYPDGEQDDDQMCAAEITAHVMEFIKWRDWSPLITSDLDMDIEDQYNYWINNEKE
jgi:hypothetical protein